jgi:hypothetical protein
MRLLTLTAALTLGVTLPAHAMDYSIEESTDKFLVIKADGHIEENELQRFYEFNQNNNINLATDTRGKILLLVSNGGSVYGAEKLADYIHTYKFGTSVLSGTESLEGCISACTIIWAAGYSRYAVPWSIGVHKPVDVINGTYNDISTNEVAQRFADSGAPESVITAAKTTPTENIYYLSCDELTAWGAVVPDKTFCEKTHQNYVAHSSLSTFTLLPVEPQSQGEPKPKPTSGETLKGHQLVSDYLAYCKKYPTDCKWDNPHKFSHLHGADID